jgi:hypothetical protein
MKKLLVSIIVFCASEMVAGQINAFKSIKIDTGECFIFARGTKSKQSFISKQFNLFHDSITHIGIGVKIDSVFKIYNVNPVKNANALTIDSFKSFANQSDLIYLGVWRLNLTEMQKSTLKNKIKAMPEYINFDYNFEIDTVLSRMYCSEFCWCITNALGDDFYFAATSKSLIELGLDKALKRATLSYVPVDYFLTFKNVEFLGSWCAGK